VNDIENIIRDSGDTRLAQLLESLLTLRQSPERPIRYFSDIRAKDIDRLVADGVVGRADDDAPVTASVFLVAEMAKSRARFILFPIAHNRAAEAVYVSDMGLVDVKVIASEVHEAEHAFAIDLTASFYQTLLPHGRRGNFVFAFDGRKYEALRMPMGATESAEIQQRITTFVFEPPPHLRDLIKFRVHVDNVLYRGKREHLTEMLCIIRERAARYKVTINESLTEDMIGPTAEFLGFIFDHVSKTISLTEKMKKKLTALAHAPDPGTRRDVLYASSLLSYVNRALGLSFGPRFGVLQAARIAAKDFSLGSSLDARTTFPKSLGTAIRQWAGCLASTPAQTVPRPTTTPTAQLWVDSSNDGYGAILAVMGVVHVAAAKRTDSMTISAAETDAVAWALHVFADVIRGGDIELFTDNIPCLFAIHRRYSRSRAVHRAVTRVYAALTDLDVRFTSVNYVRSAKNPADVPSRITDLSASGLPPSGRARLTDTSEALQSQLLPMVVDVAAHRRAGDVGGVAPVGGAQTSAAK